jgi:hypothetical protein
VEQLDEPRVVQALDLKDRRVGMTSLIFLLTPPPRGGDLGQITLCGGSILLLVLVGALPI